MDTTLENFKSDWAKFDMESLSACGYDFDTDEHDFLSKVNKSAENAAKIALECLKNGIDCGGIVEVIQMPKGLIKHESLGWIFIFREKGQRKDRYMEARKVINHIALQRSR